MIDAKTASLALHDSVTRSADTSPSLAAARNFSIERTHQRPKAWGIVDGFNEAVSEERLAGLKCMVPIPLAWMKAMGMEASARLFLTLAAFAKVTGCEEVKVGRAISKIAGCENHVTRAQALAKLEAIDLIRVDRKPGRAPLVTAISLDGIPVMTSSPSQNPRNTE